MLGVFLLMFAILLSISWLWAGGIEYMKENHPDYKGEDFLDWDEEEKPPSPCEWENVNTEGSFD